MWESGVKLLLPKVNPGILSVIKSQQCLGVVGCISKYTCVVWLLSSHLCEVCSSGMRHYVNKKFLVPLQLRVEMEDRSQEYAGCIVPPSQ